MLVEKGPELRRQNPSCTQKTKGENGDSSTSKSVLHYSRKWKTKSEGKQQISQLGTADGWMGDVGPVGAREQYWNLSNC